MHIVISFEQTVMWFWSGFKVDVVKDTNPSYMSVKVICSIIHVHQ